MPAHSSPEQIADKAYEIAFDGGGYILLGAYDRIGTGHGAGFESVDPSLIDEVKGKLCGLEVNVKDLTVRTMDIYLLEVKEVKHWEIELLDKTKNQTVSIFIKDSKKPSPKYICIKARNELRKNSLIPPEKSIDESDWVKTLSDVYNIDILDIKLVEDV